MKPLSKEKLEEIISSGEFDHLKGHYENEWFDCKKEFYIFDNEKGKRELAKDISSFANIDGGYILIGAKGENDVSHSGEQIKEISPFEENRIDIEQHRKIIEAWIYPKVENLNLNWYPSKEDNKKGLVLIKIPPQKESIKPFLIKNIWSDTKTVEIMFGLAQRIGDNSLHYELRDLHRLIQLGQDYEKNIKRRFDALESIIREGSVLSKKNYDEELEQRIETTLARTNQKEERNLVLAGYIEGDYRIKNLTSSHEILSLLETYNQPLRDGGWKLLYSTKLLSKSLDRIEIGYDSNNLSIYSDGTAIYSRDIHQISLVQNNSQIISIALIETVYHFADFYKKFINYIIEDITNIVIRVELNNLKKDAGDTNLSWDLRPNYHYEPLNAPESSMKGRIDLTKDFDPRVLAFQILKLIYEWFGFSDNPPFTKVINDVGIVDVDQITKPND